MRGHARLVLHIWHTGRNDGPPFDFQEYNSFLKDWVIRKCRSSAIYPRVTDKLLEVALKTAKWTLMHCTDKYGHLHFHCMAGTMLTHQNTPKQDIGMSPAEMLYSRTIRDHLPILHKMYQMHRCWRVIKELRVTAMVKRHLLNQKQYNMHSHLLWELQVGASAKQRWTISMAMDEDREGSRNIGQQTILGAYRRQQPNYTAQLSITSKNSTSHGHTRLRNTTTSPTKANTYRYGTSIQHTEKYIFNLLFKEWWTAHCEKLFSSKEKQADENPKFLAMYEKSCWYS